ncbi:DUF4625 domain-containing protein [Neobacillus sp. 3P2-tot-E-2]|uniref:Ig-like domain repeat protein n=1 Tax=Neobacillus sp. 3P2-tot-E-2 TaxID=3132212 RepID=UPI0039A16D64
MRKRTIIISVLCLSMNLPVGVFAETNGVQTPQINSTTTITLAEDTFGPVLESATVSPTTVNVGETFTITATVSDDASGVDSVTAYLNLPDGKGYKVLPLEQDPDTGEWKGTYTITELDLNGTWNIDFDLYDVAGNYTYGNDSDTVQVVNLNGGDAQAPTLESSSISPLSVGVNQEVTIRAKVTDNNAVDAVYASVYTADSSGYYYLPLTYDETSQEWVASHYFSESDQAGAWYVDIEMHDTAGNFDWVTLEEELVLSNPQGDFTEPTIGTPVITPKSASPGESVRLSVPVTDGQSGVSSVYAEFYHIDSPSEIYLEHLTRDPATGEWVGDFNIQSNFQSGVWNVVIHSTDNAGNSGFKEYPASFEVINNDGDFEPPVIAAVQVTPQGDVQVGDAVTVTADVSDNEGVDSVRATFYSQEGSEYVDLSYDEAAKQWTGTLLIEENTVPGFYSVSVAAYDTSGNLDFADAAGGINVVALEGDFTGPVISAIAVDKTEVNAGEQVTISATVNDAESGVASVTAHYYNNQSIALTYDSTLEKWIGTITVPTNVPDGEVVKIDYIEAVDAKNNQTVQFTNTVSFLVHNPDGDFTAPVVDSIAMTPTSAKQGETVHFDVNLADDKSGIKSATLYLYNESDSTVTTIDLTQVGTSNVWSADYVIPADAGVGTYSVSLDVTDNAGNMVNATVSEKLTVLEAAVVSEHYAVALWYYENQNLYNTVYFAGAAIDEGDKRPEVQELMDNAAQELFEAAATMSSVDAENAYQLLSATTGVPTLVKEAAQAKLTSTVDSPNYLEAVWYYDNGNYYNAVHYAGAAITEGDTSEKVQNLMDSAAQKLMDAARTGSLNFAGDAYNLLISTTGVPTHIKEEATAKLAAEVNSTKYADAQWYYENNNYYNAVYFAGAAIDEGNTRPEVQELLNNASQALMNAARTGSLAFAGDAYSLLIVTTGVPTDIKDEARAKLASEVNSTNYPEAAWYFESGNYYNAVYYAGAAIAEGNTRPEVQDLMDRAAQNLFDAAQAKDPADAVNDYSLLATTEGVPADIKAAAQAKLPQ